MNRLATLERTIISKYRIALYRKNNRVALVTGSLSGIGLGIAHSLAAKGYNVILNGFASDEEIKQTVKDF